MTEPVQRPDSESWYLFGLADQRRRGQCKHDDFLASHRAYVVVQAYHLYAHDSLNHDLHGRARTFDQLGSHLFEQVTALFVRQRLDQMLFGRGKHTLEPHDNEVIDQVRTNVLGPPAHVILLETAHAIRNSAFDFALRFHG